VLGNSERQRQGLACWKPLTVDESRGFLGCHGGDVDQPGFDDLPRQDVEPPIERDLNRFDLGVVHVTVSSVDVSANGVADDHHAADGLPAALALIPWLASTSRLALVASS
jgi:hypothetical protein